MTAKKYPLYANGHISINVDDFTYETRITDNRDNREIGSFIFKTVEDDNHSYLLITNMDIESDYRRQGIGTAVILRVKEESGLVICASRDTGMQREDGSHLTGDGLPFAYSLVEKGLIYLAD